MTLRTTRWAVRGLTVSFVAGLAVCAARAQQPPPSPSGEVRPAQTPTTQPDQPPDTQEALEKLLRLRDQMQREQEARQAEQSGAVPPARPPRRMTPARPSGEGGEPESIEQLRERARASTQRAPQPPAVEPPPPVETPLEGDEEVVGPPESLANVPPAAGATEEHTPQPLPTPTVKASPEPVGPPKPAARKPGPDEPSEWFAFDATPWEDVIAHFVQRVGKPLMTDPTDIVIGGELTYKSNQRFTKDEAIDELNLIMHEKGYRFVERENHVYILPVNEMAEHIPVERVYPTVAAFEQARLRDMDFVEVYYRVPDRKAATLVDMFSSALPYYARLSALDESNQVRIVATARDVRKFLALQKKVDLAPSDPRQMRFFEIKTNAREIERLVREFMNLGGGALMPQVQMVRDPRTGRMMPQAVGGAAASADVDMVADDRTNSIIVKATADKMKEIEELIEKFDQKPDLGEFGTHVIEIQHADATEVANLLNQIFQQEQGQTGVASAGLQRLRALQQWQQQQLARQRAARQGRAVTPMPQPMPMVGAPEEIMAEGIFERARKTIRLVADARMNALIVYANQDGLKRVRELLEVLDKPQADNLRVFALKHANVADVAPVLTQIMSGIAQTGLRGMQPGATIVPDETKNVFYVIAERDELERVAGLIAQLDVPGPQQNRRVVQLKNLKPSDVAQMIHTLLATGAARGAAGLPTGRSRFRSPVTPSGGTAATYQVIPLDDAQMLIVICTDEEWAKVEETIQLWDDAALTNSPTLETFVIEKGDAQVIANTLGNMYRSYQHPALGRSTVYIQAQGDKVLVYGVRPAIEEIAALIAMLDVEDESGGIVILPLANADATQVAQQLQLALGVSARRGTTTVIQAEPVTNSLIVQAGKVDLGKIMDFAQRMDEQVAAQTPQRKFFTPRFAEPREVVAAVQQLYAGAAAFRGRPAGSQVKVVAAGPQVIVEAPADKLAEIEAFVTQLDDPKGNEIIIKTLKLPGADVAQIASKLSNAFRTKPNLVARFDPDPQSETILLTCAKDALEQAESLIAEYAEAQRGQAPVVEFRQMTHAQATDAAGWLREQLVTYMEKQLGRNAAAMIKVTADSRTNRVVINGPQVAVTYGKLLLDQYDVPMEQPLLTVVQNEVRKLPGLDVWSLANTLSGTFRNQPRRPDGLTATFYADPTTETLIVSAPKDMFTEIDRIIAQFEAETKDLEPEQEFIEVKNADANYIAAQVGNLLNVRLVRTRGQGVAQRVNVTVDPRLNRIVLNAPKFVIPMAEALVAELDQVATTEGNIRTIALENADAGTVVGILNDVLRERFRTKRELRVSAEPLTNSVIVCGDKEDFAEIEKWVKDLDTRAEMVRGERKIIDVINVNPHEVVAVLNAQYAPKRYGQRNKLGQEISFAVVGGRSIVVQAPPDKMGEVQDFIAELDRLDPGGVQVRTFDLKVLNAMQVQIAVQNFLRDLGGNTRPGQLKPGAFAEPTTNTLVVLAPPEHMPFIEALVRDLEAKQPTQGQVQTYVLRNVRAEQVANNVDAMLKAKVAEREGAVRKTAIQTAVFAEPSTNRLFVYAPAEYQELAAKLIAMLDQEVDSNDIVHIVTLDNGDAQQIAQSLNAVIQGNLRGSGTAGARSGTATVRVTADVGSNSIILAGLPKDIAEVERWITELEGQSTRVPELQTFQLQYATTTEVQDTLKNIFPPSRNPLDAVTVSADEYTGRLIVTANRRKMRHVEQVIQQLDRKPETAEEGLLAGGRQLYLVDVNRGSPSDIAWEVRDLLPPEDRGGPIVESDWFDEYLIVKCRPSEFANIERLIRQFESRAKVEKVVRTYKPKGDPEALLQYLVARGEEVVIERATQRPQQPSLIEVLWQDGEEPASVREKKERNGAENRPVSRFETGLPLRELLLGDDDPPPAQEAGGRGSNPPPAQGGVGEGWQPSAGSGLNPPPSEGGVGGGWQLPVGGGSNPPVVPPERGDGTKLPAQADDVQPTTPIPQPSERIASPIPKEPTRIVVQPDGTLLLHGPSKEVSDITDVLDLITEDLAKGEVIRIFRFKYGDVSAAAEILSMMFDVQQRQIVIPQPQQPQRGQQQPGRQGEEGREREGLGMLEQLRGMVGGAAAGTKRTGPAPLRIATDPGHNYLIVKCEETLLPEIRQLLRELDIPPGEVQVKIFQLRGLVAEETAANIKDVLGISKVQQRRGGALPRAAVRGRPGQQGGPQQQLIEMLQQQLVSVPGVEGGAKVERVEIVANATTNSLMVSAPPEVMGLIEKVITELEELEGRDIVGIYHYPLRSARTDDLVPLLQEIFDATGGGGGAARAARGPRAAAGSPAALGPVSISGDPRTNTIIFAAEAKDVPIVEEQIRRLDTPGAVAEAETYLCRWGDAEAIAATVDAIFGTGGGAGGRVGRAGRPAAATGGASEVRIVPNAATNTIVVWGPVDKRDLIFKKIEELDKLAQRDVAEIEVRNVAPSQIVSFINMFLDQGESKGGDGRRGQTPATPPAQIVPNDNAKKLVVRGTPRQVDHVRSLVGSFDNPDIIQQTVKVIEVPHGQDAMRLAGEVERIVNQAENELAQSSGRRAKQVIIGADEYTNSIIVAGDPTLFGHVETILGQLGQVRTGAVVTRVVELRNLSADDAERIITDLQQQRRGGTTGTIRRTGGSRTRTPTPSLPATPPSGGGRRGGTRPSGGRGALPSGGVGPLALAEPLILLLPFASEAARIEGETGPADAEQQDEPTRLGDLRQAALAALQQRQPPATEPTPPAAEPPRRAMEPAPRTTPDRAPEEHRRPARTAPQGAPPTGADQPAGPPNEQQPPPEPPTSAEALLSGISGSLRGEVTAKAVDSQRLIITGDQDDVDFIEQILTMMERSSPPAVIEVFVLQNAKASALAPIIDKAIQAQIAARTARPGPQDKFSINAEARSNSLIVSASAAIMEQIAELVQRLDVEKAEGTDFRTVPLFHIRAAEAVALLKPQIEKLNKLREVPPASQASISAVDRSNSVLVIGTPKDVQDIQRLIETIDVELTAEDERGSFVSADVVLIQLRNGTADDVAKVLTGMIEEQQKNAVQAAAEKGAAPFVKLLRLRLADGRELPPLDLERPIKVLPEKGTNSLIIFSTKQNNEALTAIVEVFDTLPIGVDTDVKAFALKHAGAEQVAKLLEDIFKDKSYLARPSEGDAKGLQKGVLPPVPPGLAAKGLPYPLVVQHDARSNVVVVIGRSDAVLLAGGLIAELDRPTLSLGLKSHVLELKNTQAATLAEKLGKLLNERAKALGADKNAARDSAIIQPEERTNALIVLATDDTFDMIEDLVLQLDAADKYSVVDVRYQALRYADAPKLQGLLTEMFDAKQKAERETNKEVKDSLTVVADPRSNSLLLTGTRDYLAEAQRLIGELDQPFDGSVVFRARKVRLNSAANVASLLQEMIDKALKQQDSKLKGTPIHVAADPVSDTLLLAAAREDLAVLERWVEILDRPSEIGRMTVVIPLARAVAEDAAKAVQDVFKKPGGGGQKGGEIDVTVTADKLTNSVVAFGPPALLRDIEDFVRQLDGTEPTKGAVVQIFKLKQADAEKAGELLQSILELRGGSVGGTGTRGGGTAGNRQDADKQVLLIFQRQHPEMGLETLKAVRAEISVIADLRTNSLVVTAPPASMPLMESLVAAVDVPPEDAKIRVFRLRNADAEQMAKMLETLFERRSTTGAGRTGGAESERVLALAGGVGEGGRQEVAFTTDVRTNSVIAAGTPGYLDLVEEMILELDTIPIQERETFVYSPRNITAESLAPSIKEFSDAEQKRLQDIGEEVSIAVRQERQITAIANKDANKIVLDVDPRFRDSVMKVVRDLDQPPPQVMIQVLIVEVTMENDLELGVEFAFQDLQYAKAGPTDTTTYDYVGGTDLGAAGSGLGGFTFTITGADFNFLFRTLQSEGSLNVLSRPQIVAMDNQEAYIDISNDVPYVTGTSTTIGGQITTSVARERIGIKLEVTPQINPDGFVRMEIKQEVSDFSGSTVAVGQGVTAPVFFRREAKTTVTVKDSETVVLGGLITSRTENREQKIPILGDIPGLGLLFRNQQDTTKRSELLVVLTPRVVRTPDTYRDLSVAERDRMSVIPAEMLTDPLFEGLQMHPEEMNDLQGNAGGPPAAGSPAAVPPAPTDELYGPATPAPRPDEAPPASSPDSYDVPLTLRTATP